MKGIEVLSREQLKKVMEGQDELEDMDNGEGCIADGKSCGLFKKCCNECLPSFKCGTKSI